MPESFYSLYHWLPVITPAVCAKFLEVRAACGHTKCDLWTLCSGSSRLAACYSSLPFCRMVLFPVDLRYGWDLRCSSHQLLLLEVDKVFDLR